MDKIDYEIIKLLKVNGKLSNVELASKLFISSQAVGKRRSKLETDNVIKKYTIETSINKIAFIEVYMNSNQFSEFENEIISTNLAVKLHKITGNYCYLLIFENNIETFDCELNNLITLIEKYARYKVNISTKQI